MKLLAFCAALVGLPAQLYAQQELTFAEGEAWAHPHGALEIPANLAGLSRQGGVTYSTDYLDIGVTFRDGGHEATLYVFRRTNGSAPIWFAQAQDAIVARAGYDNPEIYNGIETVSPGGSEIALGLKAVFEPGKDSSAASTGLALYETGNWYVKLRVTSNTLTPLQTSAWLDQALSELPASDGYLPSSIISPIEDCPSQLEYHNRTRDVKTDVASSLLGGLLGQLAVPSSRDDPEELTASAEKTLWCRDSILEAGRASYRRTDADDSYLFALGDNGSAISVAPDAAAALLALSDDRKGVNHYSVTLMQESRNVNFVPQNKFPSPKRVLKILEKGRTTTVVSTWGDETAIEISSATL